MYVVGVVMPYKVVVVVLVVVVVVVATCHNLTTNCCTALQCNMPPTMLRATPSATFLQTFACMYVSVCDCIVQATGSVI